MLFVVRHAGSVTKTPFKKDLPDAAALPVFQRIERRVDPGFLENLASSGVSERFTGFRAACDRLPITRMSSALKQKHIKLLRVDDHQRRYGLLETHGFSG